MDINEIIKQTLKQQQEIFDATFKSAVIAQGHVDQLTASILKQSKVSTEGLKIYKNTLNGCSNNRDTIKKNIDNGYNSLQTFFKR